MNIPHMDPMGKGLINNSRGGFSFKGVLDFESVSFHVCLVMISGFARFMSSLLGGKPWW